MADSWNHTAPFGSSSRLVEAEDAVRDGRPGAGHPHHEAEEVGRVVVEGRAHGGRIVAQLLELGQALAGHDEQRAEPGDDQEPAREHDVDHDRAADGPQQEPRGHDHQVDDGHVLEPRAVRERRHDVERQDGDEVPFERGDGQDEGQDPEPDGDGAPGRDRHQARGDGPVALGRVTAVGLDVGEVVDHVDRARRGAERGEGEDQPPPGGELREHLGAGGRGDDEQVLGPLARPQLGEDRPQPVGRRAGGHRHAGAAESASEPTSTGWAARASMARSSGLSP